MGHFTVAGKAIAFFHQCMAHIAKPALLAAAITIEPCIRGARAFMRLVGMLLVPKVLFAVAPLIGRITATVPWPEALHGSPGVKKGPIHRKVLMRQQPFDRSTFGSVKSAERKSWEISLVSRWS